MELIEIFELSQTSRRMFARIKWAKKRIFPLKLVILHDYYRIQICDYKDKEGEGRNFKLNFTFEWKWNTITRTLDLNGNGVGTSLKNGKDRYHPGFFSPLSENFIFVWSYLLDLFSYPKINLHIDLENWKNLEKTTLDLLKNLTIPECSNLKISGIRLNRQQLLEVLEHTRIKHTLHLATSICNSDINFRQLGIFNMTRVYLLDAKHVSLNDLLNMKCEICVLISHKLTPHDIKRFIRRWCEGSNPKLFRLKIDLFRTGTNLESMLEGLEFKKWDGKRRPRYFKTDCMYSVYEKDFKEALDFKGENDRLASIMKTERHFEFVAWPRDFTFS